MATEATETKIIPNSDGQYIFSRTRPAREMIDPYDVKGVYRSQADIDRAIKIIHLITLNV